MQLDEETDADLLAALIERRAPFGLSIVNTVVSGRALFSRVQMSMHVCTCGYVSAYECIDYVVVVQHVPSFVREQWSHRFSDAPQSFSSGHSNMLGRSAFHNGAEEMDDVTGTTGMN